MFYDKATGTRRKGSDEWCPKDFPVCLDRNRPHAGSYPWSEQHSAVPTIRQLFKTLTTVSETTKQQWHFIVSGSWSFIKHAGGVSALFQTSSCCHTLWTWLQGKDSRRIPLTPNEQWQSSNLKAVLSSACRCLDTLQIPLAFIRAYSRPNGFLQIWSHV